LIGASDRRTVPVMPAPLKEKIDAERRLRALLESNGMPQPDEVEYGHWCVRFIFRKPRLCVVVDLDPDAQD
jgi:hypothetical protein